MGLGRRPQRDHIDWFHPASFSGRSKAKTHKHGEKQSSSAKTETANKAETATDPRPEQSRGREPIEHPRGCDQLSKGANIREAANIHQWTRTPTKP